MARDKTTRPSRQERVRDEDAPNPVWFKPIMFGFMLVGLAWLIVYYVSLNAFPIPDLGVGNILIGFGLILIGFLMTTRWR